MERVESRFEVKDELYFYSSQVAIFFIHIKLLRIRRDIYGGSILEIETNIKIGIRRNDIKDEQIFVSNNERFVLTHCNLIFACEQMIENEKWIKWRTYKRIVFNKLYLLHHYVLLSIENMEDILRDVTSLSHWKNKFSFSPHESFQYFCGLDRFNVSWPGYGTIILPIICNRSTLKLNPHHDGEQGRLWPGAFLDRIPRRGKFDGEQLAEREQARRNCEDRLNGSTLLRGEKERRGQMDQTGNKICCSLSRKVWRAFQASDHFRLIIDSNVLSRIRIESSSFSFFYDYG